MFESVQEKKQPDANRFGILFGAVAAFVVVGMVVYMMATHGAKPPASSGGTTEAAAGAPKTAADAVRDLKVFRVKMEKDHMGTTAVWTVTIENKSKDYTYGDIQYETSYFGADNAALVVNQGKISTSIEPSGQQNYTLRDVLYPMGTSWYKFRITGATPSAQ
ncbi:MAG: hypothetical protein GZ088_13815 [Acidipila sp.]|nr:hypothetical protein [Acidipila sp.]